MRQFCVRMEVFALYTEFCLSFRYMEILLIPSVALLATGQLTLGCPRRSGRIFSHQDKSLPTPAGGGLADKTAAPLEQ